VEIVIEQVHPHDVYPGNGDWTRLFSDAVGPDGRVFGFVPTEILDLKSDQVDLMRTLAKEPGHQNVEGVSADIVAMPEATQTADVVWMHLFYHDLHTALSRRGARPQPSSIAQSTTG
jgi:predicted methyltransferase